MFLPKDDYGITRFMPLPSYLEAGKFKLQKDLLNIDSSDEAGGNDKERYIFTYQKIKVRLYFKVHLYSTIGIGQARNLLASLRCHRYRCLDVRRVMQVDSH